MSEPQPGEQTVYVADSVDEFVERTRLQEILEARQRAAEALQDSQLRRVEARQSGAAEWEVNQAVDEPARAAVESYIYEVERLYRGTEEGRKLWDEAPIGEFDIAEAVAASAPQNIGRVADIQAGGQSLSEVGTTLRVVGVSEFLELAGKQVTVTHERELPRRGRPTETVTDRVELTTPVHLSREAFRATNALLASSDLGVKVGPGDGNDVRGDYADLLDEMGARDGRD